MAAMFICIGYFRKEDERIEKVLAGLKRLGRVELSSRGEEKTVYDMHCGRLSTAIHNRSMSEEEFIVWLEEKVKTLLEGAGLVFKLGDQLPLPRSGKAAA